MNYIYDILLNFNSKLYDFYEWNETDDIIHIRKIPLYKINSEDFKKIKNNKVKVNHSFLEQIKNKTEIFTNKSIKTIEYACIISDTCEVIALLFDKSGIVTKKSRLLIDEDIEVLEVAERIKEIKINYDILVNENNDNFKTRKEIEIDEYIQKEIGNIVRNNNIEKLKYLYYECFNSRENNKNKIIKRINKELKYNWNNIAYKLYNFFKLTSINK